MASSYSVSIPWYNTRFFKLFLLTTLVFAISATPLGFLVVAPTIGTAYFFAALFMTLVGSGFTAAGVNMIAGIWIDQDEDYDPDATQWYQIRAFKIGSISAIFASISSIWPFKNQSADASDSYIRDADLNDTLQSNGSDEETSCFGRMLQIFQKKKPALEQDQTQYHEISVAEPELGNTRSIHRFLHGNQSTEIRLLDIVSDSMSDSDDRSDSDTAVAMP